MENNSQEALLEEAKQRYPIGTKFKNAAGSHSEYIVENVNYKYGKYDNIWALHSNRDKGVCIYSEGKWAEILEEVKPDDWEPSTETCKNCADRFYDGHVNTGQHNLCEGRHCQDMRESEEEWVPKVGDWIWSETNIPTHVEAGIAQILEFHLYTYLCDYKGAKIHTKDKNVRKALAHEIPKKDINKDLQWKPSIEEHFIVPLTSEKCISLLPQEVIPTLSKNKRKKLEVFIPNNKQESRPFQTIKLKNTSK